MRRRTTTMGCSRPFLEDLRRVLKGTGLICDTADAARYAQDTSGERGARPLAVLRPATTEELAAAIRVCHRHDVPVVPQGGRTGLSGGANCREGNVVLSTERMSGVISLDRDACTLAAWAGTPLQYVQEAARQVGLDYPVDIGSRGSATIGGTIATNAGGIRVVRYGMTRQNVLGLETVLADGTILSDLNPLLKNNAGYDLKQLFIGSEGTLGIITRAVLKLVPATTLTQTALVGLPGYGAALECLSLARMQLGASLVAFEGMWPSYWDFVCHEAAMVHAPLAERHGMYVLVEAADHGECGPNGFEAWLAACFEKGIVEDGVIAQSLSETQALWAVREAVGEVDDAFGPHINFDVGIASSQLGGFVEACDLAVEGLTHRPSLQLGHIGDGNLHLLVEIPDNDADITHQVEDTVYGLVGQWNGSLTAEHGVGTLKRNWLDRTRSPAQIAVMRRLKAMLDPKGLLNPGKVLPDQGDDAEERRQR